MMPLTLLNVGERGEIVAVRETAEACGGDGLRTGELGLRVGKIVEMLNRGGAGGPVLLKIDESRIAVARGAAMKIMVRRES
jgi:ferrous iron transport protein A